MPLTILARPAAKPEFQTLASLKTGTGGKWTLTTHPKIGTAYQVQSASATSRILGVGVHPDVSVRVISGARVWTHVGASRSLAGRSVQLQQLTEGQWRTVAKANLNGSSDAIFPVGKGARRRLDVAHRHEREPGRRRSARCLQQAVRLPALGGAALPQRGPGHANGPARPLLS